MKKQLVVASLVMLGIFTISCGGKNGETKSESEAKKEEVADCPCNSLMDESGSLKNKNFTGICTDKDQNDTIILKREYKNGYLISEMKKEKVNGKYFVTEEMNYENGKQFNGFELDDDSYASYKNGKIFNSYETYIVFSKSRNEWDIRAGWVWKDGQNISLLQSTDEELFNKLKKPTSMSDANELDDSYLWYYSPYPDKETGDEILRKLEKELPYSAYIIEKGKE